MERHHYPLHPFSWPPFGKHGFPVRPEFLYFVDRAASICLDAAKLIPKPLPQAWLVTLESDTPELLTFCKAQNPTCPKSERTLFRPLSGVAPSPVPFCQLPDRRNSNPGGSCSAYCDLHLQPPWQRGPLQLDRSGPRSLARDASNRWQRLVRRKWLALCSCDQRFRRWQAAVAGRRAPAGVR